MPRLLLIIILFLNALFLAVDWNISFAAGNKAGSFGVFDELATITITNQPANSTAGGPLEGENVISPPAVVVEDINGTPQQLVAVTVSLMGGDFTAGSTTTVNTNSLGVALFENLVIDEAGTGYRLVFTTGTGNVEDLLSDPFDVSSVTGQMTILEQPAESIESYPVAGPPAIFLGDETSSPLEGIDVTAYLSKNGFDAESDITVATGADGVALFDNLVIDIAETGYTIYFKADRDGIATVNSEPSFDVVEELAVLSIIQEPGLTIAGETINGPPKVLIVNKSTGNPISGINIHVTLNKGDFGSGTTMVTTNASGEALFTDLIIDDDDTGYQLVFSTRSSGVQDIASEPFEVIPVAGTISIDPQPDTSIEGYPLSGPPSVTILDPDDQPVQGVEITVSLNKNSFTSGTETVTTGIDGKAVFDDLVIDDIDSGYTISFGTEVSTGIAAAISDPFDVVEEIAALSIDRQPALTIAGERINGPPAVRLETMRGLPVSGATISAVLNKGGFSGASVTSATTNTSGIAVFDDLVIDDPDNDYEITFSTGSTGVADIKSDYFDVIEVAGIMNISVQPKETVFGHPVAGPPTITLTGPNGDPWEGDEVTINVSINKNGFTGGTLSRETANGIAVFNDLLPDAIDSNYELLFTSDVSNGIPDNTSDLFNVVAVTGYLEITLQPSETVQGDPVNGPPSVRLTNILGNPVPGVAVSVTLNKNEFTAGSTLTATTNSSGFAVFGNLIIDSFDTDYRITFSAGASGVADAISDPFEVTDASLDMEVTSQPEETTAGAAIEGPPAVTITDSEGGIPGIVVTAFVNKGSFASGSIITATTDENGTATFPSLIINTADQGYIITFNASFSGVPNSQSAPFTVTSAAASYISVITQPLNSIAGQAIAGSPAVAAFDQFGNRVPGLEVTVEPNQHTASFSGTTTVVTNENGEAVFNDLIQTRAAVNYALFFTATGVTTGNSALFSISNGPPHTISILTQPSETVAGAAISGPPAVSVLDEFDNPVQGELITISEEGGYTLDEGTLQLVTPSTGIVAFEDLVITTVGSGYRFIFSIDGIQESSSAFNVVPGTVASRFRGNDHSGFTSSSDDDIPLGQRPYRIHILSHPSESVAGGEVEGPPRIIVFDELDNAVPDVAVTVSGALFSQGITTLSSDSQGEIEYRGLVIDVPGTYTLTFTADDYSEVTAESQPFDVLTPLAEMAVETGPATTVAGEAVAGHPVVSLKNTLGMPIPGVEISVYVNQHGFASGTLTVVTNASGEAVFDDLVLNTAAGNYQLIFDAAYPGVLNISSGIFEVISAPAHTISIITQPAGTTEGSAVNGPPSVMVSDQFGNPVSGASVTVSEIITGSFDSGTTTVVTGPNGVAEFTSLVIKNPGTYQLSFSVPGLPEVLSNSFQVVSGTSANRFRGSSHSGFISDGVDNRKLGQTPVRISITGQPRETVAGFLVEGPPRIVVYDETDNPVANIQVTASLSGGSFSSGTLTRTTGSNGEIIFNDLVIDEAGSYRITFSADNHTATVEDVESEVFEVIGQLYYMQILSEPGNSVAGEPVEGPPVVSVTNFIYQPLAGVDVTIYINQNGFFSGTLTVQTNSNGEAVFDDLVITTAADNYQFIFDADYPGIINVTSGLFNVTNAPPSVISIITQPGTTFEGAVISGPPSVALMDEFGNPAAGVTVSVAETGGYEFEGGTLTQITGLQGTAMFNDLIIESHGQYSLTFSADNAEDALSFLFSVLSGTVENRFKGSSHSGFISEDTDQVELGQVPVRIEIITQPSETVTGEEISGPPSIRVYDEMDNPVGGIEITVTGAPFTSGSITGLTGENGEIVFNDLVIDTPGTYQLTFSADETEHPMLADAVSSLFEVVDPQLFMTVQAHPAETVAGETLEGPPTVRLTNAIGQGFGGVEITVYLNQHGFASEEATQTVITDGGGLAIFDELVINVAAQGYQLIFDARYGGVVNVVSGTFDIVSAPAHAISITTQPANTESGAVIGGPPTVAVTDEFGNPVSGAGVEVSETGGYIFDGGTVNRATGQAGIVSFNDLIINSTGWYSLTFSVTGTDNAVSGTFNVMSGSSVNRFRGDSHSGFISEEAGNTKLGQTPSRIEVIMQPSETVVGFEIAGPPTVAVYDELDRPVPGIEIAANVTGGFSTGSTITMTSDENGEAVFDNLVIETTGTYNLAFSAPDHPEVQTAISLSFEVTDQILSMTMETQPGETIAGQAITGSPAVQIRNSIMQPVAGIDVTVYLNQNHFDSGPETRVATTDANGIALFDELVINLASPGYQLIFIAAYPGVGNASSDLFSVIPADPVSLQITTQPLNTEAGAIIGGPPTVSVTDIFGNTVPEVSVTVAETGGYTFDAGTVSRTTNGGGLASFDDLIINVTGQYRLNFLVDNIDPVQSFYFNILSGTAYPRFRGNTHSGFISEIIEGELLSDESCSAVITLESLDDFVCQGEEYQLRVDFIGEAPFTFRYTDGFNEYLVEGALNTEVITVEAHWEGPLPTVIYNYTIIELTDNRGCTAAGTGGVSVTVYKRPSTGPLHHIPNNFEE